MKDPLGGYSFKSKLAEGERGERFIAACVSRFGRVYPATGRAYQMVGIDAFMVSERWGYTSLQFKQCNLAQRFGNAFIEVEILDAEKNRTDFGWAYKTTANFVLYWCVGMGRIYIIETTSLKRELPKLLSNYPTGEGRSVENGRVWYGRGIRLPLLELERSLCRGVLHVREQEAEFLSVEGMAVGA